MTVNLFHISRNKVDEQETNSINKLKNSPQIVDFHIV